MLKELFLVEPNRLFRKGAGHKQNGSTIDCLLVFFYTLIGIVFVRFCFSAAARVIGSLERSDENW